MHDMRNRERQLEGDILQWKGEMDAEDARNSAALALGIVKDCFISSSLQFLLALIVGKSVRFGSQFTTEEDEKSEPAYYIKCFFAVSSKF